MYNNLHVISRSVKPFASSVGSQLYSTATQVVQNAVSLFEWI